MLKSVNNFEKWHRPTFYLMQTGFWIAGGAVHTAFSKGKGFIEFNLRKFPGKSKTSWENYFRCRAVKCLSFDLLYLFWYLCLVNANFLGKLFQCLEVSTYAKFQPPPSLQENLRPKICDLSTWISIDICDGILMEISIFDNKTFSLRVMDYCIIHILGEKYFGTEMCFH